jgi:hypothetical protein
MAWYADLATAVRAAVVAAWPEVAVNGVYHELELGTVVFFRKSEDADLPIAAFGFSLQSSQEYGADQGAEDGELRIYYITTDATSMDTLVGKLETMRDQLWGTALTCGQIMAFPSIDFSLDLTPNQYFLANQRPNVAGCVRARLVVGEIA